MEKQPSPQFKFENENGEEIKSELLPAIKDLKNIWNKLFLNHETPEEAERFAKHVSLFQFNSGKSIEHYLILTNVKKEKADDLIEIFGAQKEPIQLEVFLSDVAHAKAVKNLPRSFDNQASQVYKIFS